MLGWRVITFIYVKIQIISDEKLTASGGARDSEESIELSKRDRGIEQREKEGSRIVRFRVSRRRTVYTLKTVSL